jgi:microsomal dipeptidase-like Zn-dependent dipeptidase
VIHAGEHVLVPSLWWRAFLVWLVSLKFNFKSLISGPRVRMKYMREGGVEVVFSVVYSFFDEFDVRDGLAPHASYLSRLEDQMDTVEDHLAESESSEAMLVTNRAELKRARAAGKLAVVHCVEGGFHLGGEKKDVRNAVKELADRGVAYITLAHLRWREIATDAPAIPFLDDDEYRKYFPQPAAAGLSELGKEAVKAMKDHHVMVDISHMSDQSIDDTFKTLDQIDAQKSVPVLATHAGYRFGAQHYMLDVPTILRIKERNGLIGLIFAQHQLYDGLTDQAISHNGRPLRKLRRFDDALAVLKKHIDRIYEITGSHEHTAIGSDLDGFIRPTLPQLEDMRDMAALESALREEYGSDADLICTGNATRLLEEYWEGGA